jgi:SAM-dependent methyltransferase
MLSQISLSSDNTPFAPIKARQQAAWSAGDYAAIGSTLQFVGETLCEALDVRSGQRLLDVAAGNGNAALAAARRGCIVTASDYVPALLERAAMRVAADGLVLECRVADAEALPFADAGFDLVTSTFGAMFTPEHERPARQMLRVCRSGGKIGLANWTPDSFIGQLFQVIGGHVAPPPGLVSPALWGTQTHLQALFGHQASVTVEARDFVFRYRSAAHWIDTFRSWYGPVLKAFAALPPAGQQALHADLEALVARFNRADDGTMVVPSAYLEAIIVKH